MESKKENLPSGPDVRMIVAVGRDGAIGKKGDLVWHLRGDLRRFRQLTMGHAVIMGRKTWESLPKKPLSGRRNIVVTTSADYNAEGAETAHSPLEALKMAGEGIVYVMGGAKIYESMLPMVGGIDLTLVDAECEDADARLNIDYSQFEELERSAPETSEEGVKYCYVTLQRKGIDSK